MKKQIILILIIILLTVAYVYVDIKEKKTKNNLSNNTEQVQETEKKDSDVEVNEFGETPEEEKARLEFESESAERKEYEEQNKSEYDKNYEVVHNFSINIFNTVNRGMIEAVCSNVSDQVYPVEIQNSSSIEKGNWIIDYLSNDHEIMNLIEYQTDVYAVDDSTKELFTLEITYKDTSNIEKYVCRVHDNLITELMTYEEYTLEEQ